MSDLKSVSGGVQVPSASSPTDFDDYVVPTPPTVGVIVSDDFEAQTVGAAPTGFWYAPNNSSVTSEIAHTGSKCLKLAWPAGQGNGFAEQRFALNGNYPEVYMQYYIYFLDGTEGLGARFVHYAPPVGTDNNKMLRLWGEEDTDGRLTNIRCGYSMWPTSAGDNKIHIETQYPNQIASTTCRFDLDKAFGALWSDNATFITNARRGRWLKINFHAKAASSANNDGVLEMHIDNVLALGFYSEPINATPPCPNVWQHGYLGGANNAEYDADTNVYIDNFIISTRSLL